MAKAGAEKTRSEEMQRAEKRIRESKGQQFTPRWFDNTDDKVVLAPWGGLEVYEFNGKYSEHWVIAGSSDSNVEVDVTSVEFNPWQYGNVAVE